MKSNILDVNVNREVKMAIGKTSNEFLNLNREQLLHGRRADDTTLPKYSWISVVWYGKPNGPIMLYDTGDFHKSFKLDVGETDLNITANDKYGLEDEYGEEIYGLGGTNQRFYNEEIFFPVFAGAIEKITGLKAI